MKRLWLLLLLAGSIPAAGGVRTGLQVLQEQRFAPLWGKRVGVLVNHTAVDAEGHHLVDLLAETPGVDLTAVFTPEHGLTGRVGHGQAVEDSVYPGTSVPVYSLYGKTRRPPPETLRGLDVLVCDLPDTGARFYTYITTLGYALEEATAAGLEVIVLDRPNPLGGAVVEGVVLSTAVRHFTAYYSIPTRHGLTMGEVARWHNEKAGLDARLLVIPMEGWKREMLWEETGLPFLAPSPNIPTARTALLYVGVGAFESTNVSVGRGTLTPFHLFGAPWMKHRAMARSLARLKLPGFRFRSVVYRPTRDRYKGKKCYGVHVEVTDAHRARPVDLFIHAACLLRDMSPKKFRPRWREMPRVIGAPEFETWFQAGESAETLLERIHASAEAFVALRESILLYP